jgi:monofunctional biosynthetic peptidoglycan transglycosylase
MKLKRIILIIFVILISFIVYFYLSLPDIEYLKNKNPVTTALIKQRLAEAKKSGKSLKIRQKWVASREIPMLLKRAIRISEDANFYQHDGIDYFELQEAVKKNISKGKLSRGGSTITQQLAKNLYLSTRKSIFRKCREFFITKRLEKELSKNRIYHLYLNVIEFGPGIFGVEAAANYYYGRKVSGLNLEQIIRLTAVIPRPLSIHPNSKRKWLLWRCKWILRKLYLYRYISRNEYEYMLLRFERK